MNLLDSLNFGSKRRLPMLLQTQAAECGLACVGMLANYLGHRIDMVTLRRRFQTSLKGSTLNDVVRFASALDITSRALRLDLDEMDQLRTPCILHWEMNHFVVLKKVTKTGIVIHDPARGIRKVPMEEASRAFTGVALELMPSPSFKPVNEEQKLPLLGLLRGVDGIRSAAAQVLILSVAMELFGVLSPFYMQWVMDKVLVSADRDLLSVLSIGFLMVILFKSAIGALRSWVVTWFSSLLSVQWSAAVCRHLLALPSAFFEQRHVGDIVSRFGSLGSIQNTLTTRFISTILDGAMAIITLVMLFLYSATLSWLVLALFALYTIVRLASYRPFRQANEDQLVYAAKSQSLFLESIRGIQAIKLGNQQDARAGSYANTMVDVTNKSIAIQRLSIGFSTAQGVISGVGRIALIWLAAKQVLDGSFSAGMLVAFVSFSDQFVGRATGLVDAVMEFRMLRLHGERLADIVLTDVEEDSEGTGLALSQECFAPPALELKGIKFQYGEAEPWVLDDCSLRINPGESLALVGPSGQGKSTLVKVILGLLKPQGGVVAIDGADIRKVGLSAYRSRIGCVMQDDILFAGSIAENISFFDANPSQPLIEEAARLAQIHGDIASMPMGYMTLVGDMGSSLSGGQVQRVLLARAFYRKPSILVLDEATSHLDVERERLINDAVKAMNMTRIIIAHRPETIRSADRIVVVQAGKLFEVPRQPPVDGARATDGA